MKSKPLDPATAEKIRAAKEFAKAALLRVNQNIAAMLKEYGSVCDKGVE